jgi:hypothetical protein
LTDHDYGQAFFRLFSRFEHGLKRSNFLREGRKDAQADWNAFAKALGNEFFDHVVESKIASTLILDPPARLLRDRLEWERPQRPLQDVTELFTRGVCRVRNSYFHGEKFVGGEDQDARDRQLVDEALNVLEAARRWHPEIAAHVA